MELTPALATAFLNFAVQFGLKAATAIMTAINKPKATVDDAIAATQDMLDHPATYYLQQAGGPVYASPVPPSPPPPTGV